MELQRINYHTTVGSVGTEENLIAQIKGAFDSFDLKELGLKFVQADQYITSSTGIQQLNIVKKEFNQILNDFINNQLEEVTEALSAVPIRISTAISCSTKLILIRDYKEQLEQWQIKPIEACQNIQVAITCIQTKLNKELVEAKEDLRVQFLQEIQRLLHRHRTLNELPDSGITQKLALALAEDVIELHKRTRIIENASLWRLGKELRANMRYIARHLNERFKTKIELEIVEK